MNDKYTYNDAFVELQDIVAEIESGDSNIDELAEKIKRAASLIAICKTKLTASEKEVDNLLQKLNQEDTAEQQQPE